ncbi:HEAT repeat domain-containing protein [Microscilla marina]|uniref:HEAT repeat domain-containing protein n=1 Tax=Microscilla marina ATCC 23134 TaxID=313606 RepID=A2A0L1_MICM2|nr:HEAT repeat domain-containing protein [Microscilla marina]EAY23828.1 hypothetical protein M23134_04591 [Microscilla marina ATCC 23134]
MDSQKIELLLEKYYKGDTTLKEESLLIEYFTQDEQKIPVQLRQYQVQFQFFAQAQSEAKLGDQFDKQLEKMIAMKEDTEPSNETAEVNKNTAQLDTGVVQIRRSSLQWGIGIAASLLLVVASFFAGRLSVETPKVAQNNQNDTVQKQLQEMQATLAKLKKPSASERLKAVKTTARNFTDNNDQAIDALINTLNSDENQNVRLAAANALFVYKDNPKVRNALIVSISHQTDPVVKIAMVNMLLALKDKRVKEPIERILKNDKEIPEKVKEVIQNNLKAI